MLQVLFENLAQALIGGVVDFTVQDRRNDPVYKKNLQRLIERNRQFEEAKKA
jgi:hypothetical protein